jgi:hypothetical protein
MTDQDEYPWEGQCTDAAYEFGSRCANLVAQNPHKMDAPLDFLVNAFMTELWDRNFGQSEIRAAFEGAVRGIPHYADAERRSATSAELAIADWRQIKS